MPILNIQVDSAGQSGQVPKFIYISTNDTVAEVTTAGYLNGIVAQNVLVSEYNMALVATKTTPNAVSTQVDLYDVSYSGGNWSLTLNSGSLILPNGQIFIGNGGGVATARTMSGDATISNTGVLTISNLAVNAAKLAADAVTTAKILNANVTLAKLAAGITPSHIVKFAGTQANGGGSATITITVTGMLISDLPFVAIQASTNAVSIQKVTPTADTITVLLSGDPGAATTLSYQVLRAAA
ncbi:MAG: hypothetical protein K5Q00_01345 [Gammaproteobacteria bacterium]|nr:hypothetical protein [Gammaproteobacteria bacterium]